jgi:hypothetical protein
MIRGNENFGSAVPNHGPKTKDNLDCMSRRTDTGTGCTFGLSILQLYI